MEHYQTHFSHKDWVGEWFKIRSELGHDTTIGFLKGQNDQLLSEEWYELPHCRYDGIGALRKMVQEEGLPVPPTPFVPSKYIPKLYEWPKIFLDFIRSAKKIRKLPPAHWKYCNDIKNNNRSYTKFSVLTPLETAMVKKAAKAQGISLNTYLLYSLNKACAELFHIKNLSCAWVLPINVRGFSSSPDTYSNQSSFAISTIYSSDSYKDLQKRMAATFKARGYLITWKLLHIGKVIGKKGLRRLLRKKPKNRSSIIGSFSNIGEWEHSPEIEKNPDVFRVVMCLSSMLNPIFGVSLIWNKKLSLTLNIHPQRVESQEQVQRILDKWKKSLLLPVKGTEDLMN